MVKHPLSLALTIPFLILIIATVGLTGYLAFENGQKAVDNIVMQLFSEINIRLDQHLDNYMGTAFMINQINLNSFRAGQANSSDLNYLGQYFWDRGQQFPDFGTMGFGNDRGEIAGSNDVGKLIVIANLSQTGIVLRRYAIGDDGKRTDQILSERINYDARNRDWYQIAVKEKQPAWTSISPSLAGPWLAITAVTPYYGPDGGLLGVFYDDVHILQIDQYLRNISISNHGQIFIMETNGLIIASSTPEPPYHIEGDQIERLNATSSSQPLIAYAAGYLKEKFPDPGEIPIPYQSRFDIQKERYFIYVNHYIDARGLDWRMVIVVPESDFMAQIALNNRNTLVLIIFSLLISIFVSVLLARRITRPLSDLSRSAKAIAHGDYYQSLEIKRDDEVGELTDAFNKMAFKLRENLTSLQENEEIFRCLLEYSPIYVFFKDENMRAIRLSKNFETMLGKPLNELLGKRMDELFPSELARSMVADDMRIMKEDNEFTVEEELNGRLYSTTKFPIYIDGKLRYLAGYSIDITEHKQKEEALRASLEEKTVLLSEIHHRVKNNLQIVSSLINLQAMRTRNREVLENLRETGNRIHSMALLHETLYGSGNLAKVNFSSYIKNICVHIIHSYGAENIILEPHLADITIELDQALSCGLIINELVSNALKHAFPGERKGKITVELQELPDNQIMFAVADDGIGLPQEVDINKSETLGLKLVSMLTEKLKGNIELIRDGGTTFRIIFKVK